MSPDEQLLGDLDRQLVHAMETGGQKHAEPAGLIAPELFIVDELTGRIEQSGDFRRAVLSREPLCRNRQQIAQPDRILAHLAPGGMARHIDRDGRPLVAADQFVQVVSHEHWRTSGDKALLSQPGIRPFRSAKQRRKPRVWR